jgi:micrococcal nuclease
MSNLFYLLLLVFIATSCSTAQTQEPNLITTYKPIIITPVRVISTNTQNTPTENPTLTAQPSETATIIPTVTATPIVEIPVGDIAECIPRNPPYQKGIVTEIIDGDTIIVRFEDGNIYSVRYIGIDAPEREMPFFTESYNANAELVHQKEVLLIKDVSETDQFDRLLRYIVVDDIFVNQALVEAGAARAMQYPPDLACAETFSLSEQAAQTAFRGLWIATPTPGIGDAQVVIVAVNKRDEYVDIQNMGAFDVDLAGWNLVSERGHQGCYLSGIITAGEILRIWAGSAQGGGFSCGYGNPIWNNSEVDPAVLYNAQGVEVSRK